MQAYQVATTLADDPSVSFTMTVMAASQEAAVQKVLTYLRLEFQIPEDANYHYRAA